MTHRYYIQENNETSKPLSFEELKSKRINENTYVWRKGLKDWVKARALKELEDIILFLPPQVPKTIEEQASIKDSSTIEDEPKIKQSLVSPRSIYRTYNVLLWISLFYFFGCLIAFGGQILMSIYSHFTPEQLLIGLTLGVSTLFILMIAVFWCLFIIKREIKTLLTSGNCSNKMIFQIISKNFWRPFILTIIFIVIFLFILPYQWI